MVLERRRVLGLATMSERWCTPLMYAAVAPASAAALVAVGGPEVGDNVGYDELKFTGAAMAAVDALYLEIILLSA